MEVHHCFLIRQGSFSLRSARIRHIRSVVKANLKLGRGNGTPNHNEELGCSHLTTNTTHLVLYNIMDLIRRKSIKRPIQNLILIHLHVTQTLHQVSIRASWIKKSYSPIFLEFKELLSYLSMFTFHRPQSFMFNKLWAFELITSYANLPQPLLLSPLHRLFSLVVLSSSN